MVLDKLVKPILLENLPKNTIKIIIKGKEIKISDDIGKKKVYGTLIKTEYDKKEADRVDILAKAENYEEEVKKAENAPYVKTIWWNFGFIVVATAAIITVNTIQNKKVLKELEELKKSNKETKKK